jgi:hypothetical protein
VGRCAREAGKTKEALAKYNEALKYTPNWKQLKEAREAAAKHADLFGFPIGERSIPGAGRCAHRVFWLPRAS